MIQNLKRLQLLYLWIKISGVGMRFLRTKATFWCQNCLTLLKYFVSLIYLCHFHVQTEESHLYNYSELVCEKKNRSLMFSVDRKIPTLGSHWNGGLSGWDFPVRTEHQWWILFINDFVAMLWVQIQIKLHVYVRSHILLAYGQGFFLKHLFLLLLFDKLGSKCVK